MSLNTILFDDHSNARRYRRPSLNIRFSQKNFSCFMLYVLLALGITQNGVAQTQDKSVALSDLNWIDQKYFDKQRALIDDLGRETFGQRVRKNITDVELLQRIINTGKIGIYDTDEHKALGIVLGDVYVAEQGWQWREYRDKQGKSRGVCIPDTTHCVFPISMMTRRLRLTHKIEVKRIYERGLTLMADVIPQNPYDTTEKTPTKENTFDTRGKKIVPFL